MDRDSFITYKTWVEGIEEMPEELQSQAYKIISHYALYGEKPDKTTPWALRSFFYGNVKKSIDDNIRKYEELSQRRREAGKKGMAVRWGNRGNNAITDNNKNNKAIFVNNKNNLYDNDNDNVYDNVIKEKKKKEKTTTTTFIPPTLEAVQTYIVAKNYQVDAEAFIAYYESNGWMVGKNKMKNWKAAVVTWQKKENQYNNTKPNNYGTGKNNYNNSKESKQSVIDSQKLAVQKIFEEADREWEDKRRNNTTVEIFPADTTH